MKFQRLENDISDFDTGIGINFLPHIYKNESILLQSNNLLSYIKTFVDTIPSPTVKSNTLACTKHFR